MAKIMPKKGRLVSQILEFLAESEDAGALTIKKESGDQIGSAARKFGKWYREHDKFGRYRIRRVFGRLRRNQLLDMVPLPNGDTKIILTTKGKRLLAKNGLKRITIEAPKHWDKKWRLVLFDVPESKKIARTEFRLALVRLGFIQFQKSVWLFPYDCAKEIRTITDHLEISNFVHLGELSNFDSEKELRSKLRI